MSYDPKELSFLTGSRPPYEFNPLIQVHPGVMSPIKLLTVNTVPERAKRIIGTIVDEVSDKYEILHVANAERRSVPVDKGVWIVLSCSCRD